MRWFLFLNNFLLFLCLICEDLKRPKKKEDCFERTFVGEFNQSNALCCFLYFKKFDWPIYKCSVHFKDEIENNAVDSTMEFLKNINTQYESEDSKEIEIISFDCKQNYIKIKSIFSLILSIL